jgi:hypothetical protein
VSISDNPIGSLDLARVEPAGIHLAGWVLDPNTADPTQVHVYADGVGQAFPASGSRPDVAAINDAYGPAHGFDFFVPVPAGELCVYGFNLLQGDSTLLDCPMLSSDPFGSFETVYMANGVRRAAGWAIDPNTSDPIDVHVYVGAVGTATTASTSRPDVADASPLYGSAHGFDVEVPPGTDPVCAYAINVAAGTNVLLGCNSGG